MHNLTPLASGPRVPGSQGSGPCSPCLLGHSRSPPPDGTVKATIPEMDRDPCRGLETVTPGPAGWEAHSGSLPLGPSSPSNRSLILQMRKLRLVSM